MSAHLRHGLSGVASHPIEISHLLKLLESIWPLTNDWLRECHMDELRLEFEVEHFGGQMLSTSVVEGYTTILAASDQQVSIGRIGDRFDRFIKLSEVVANARLLNIKNSHRSRSETA